MSKTHPKGQKSTRNWTIKTPFIKSLTHSFIHSSIHTFIHLFIIYNVCTLVAELAKKSSHKYFNPCGARLEELCLLCALWRLILCCSVVSRGKTGVKTQSSATRLSWSLSVDHHWRLTSTPDWVSGLLRLPTTTCKLFSTQKAKLATHTPLRFADDSRVFIRSSLAKY